MNLFSRWRQRRIATDEAVYVTEKSGVRSLHIGSDTIQSSMRISRPNDLELAYTRSMMAFLLFREPPARALMIGLGGGSLAKFVYHRMPGTATEVVEVSPQVVAIARRLFGVPPADERLTVRVCDGAEFVAREGQAFGVILVDGYDGESQVAELSSSAFYQDCGRRLEEGGLLVVNLWGSDRRFNEYVQRIEAAYPAGSLCLPAEKPGNVIMIAFRDRPDNPRWDDLERRAAELTADYGLEFGRFVRALRKMNHSDADTLHISGAP